MGYAAEIFEIFYSQWDYQMMNISRILKFFTWHGFDKFGWNDPVNTSKYGWKNIKDFTTVIENGSQTNVIVKHGQIFY